MSDIYVDRPSVERRINDLLAQTDDLDKTLGSMPVAPDGGIATSVIAFIASAAAEAGGLSADSYRALGAITIDVMKDMSLTETQIQDIFEHLDDQVDKS